MNVSCALIIRRMTKIVLQLHHLFDLPHYTIFSLLYNGWRRIDILPLLWEERMLLRYVKEGEGVKKKKEEKNILWKYLRLYACINGRKRLRAGSPIQTLDKSRLFSIDVVIGWRQAKAHVFCVVPSSPRQQGPF